MQLKDLLLSDLPIIPVCKNSKRPLIRKWSRYCEESPTPDQSRDWLKKFPDMNVGICCGPSSGLVGFDMDLDLKSKEDVAIFDSIKALVPESPLEKTGKKGFTRFFKYNGEKSESIRGAGKTIIDILSLGRQTVIPPSIHPETKRPYFWKGGVGVIDFDISTLPFLPQENLKKIRDILGSQQNAAGIGGRNDSLKSYVVARIHQGADDLEISNELVAWDEEYHPIPLFSDPQEPQMRGKSPEQNALAFTQSIRKTVDIPQVKKNESLSPRKWPDPINLSKMGETVKTIIELIEPHSEADPNGLIVQFLVTMGNVAGRRRYFQVAGDEHYPNLFCIGVGKSSKARKGTSIGVILNILKSIDKVWEKQSLQSGLSSGEGLIWKIKENKEENEKKGLSCDLRLLPIETEFASVLKVLEREGNTLSAILRDSWDRGHLATLTKNSPAKVKNAHVSLIGHITEQELGRYLKETEKANGFGNRFLWFCVKRSKLLPSGGELYKVDIAPVVKLLKKIVDFNGPTERMVRTLDAEALWCDVYEKLSEDRDGLFGSITARAEAQVLRLSLIFALLDLKTKVDVPHLEAALEVWRYCEESCLYIFGQSFGDPVKDQLITALNLKPDGLTSTEIRDLFGRHKKADVIRSALFELKTLGVVDKRDEPGKGSKPKEIWFKIQKSRQVAV